MEKVKTYLALILAIIVLIALYYGSVVLKDKIQSEHPDWQNKTAPK